MTTKMKGKIQDRATKPTMLLKKMSAFLLKEWIPTLSTFSFLIFDNKIKRIPKNKYAKK